MSDHHCPGVGWCEKHPRWHVARFKIHGTLDAYVWVAFGPHDDRGKSFPTHAEAIIHAQKEAIPASAEWYQQGA